MDNIDRFVCLDVAGGVSFIPKGTALTF